MTPLPARPVFSAHLRVESVPGEGAVLAAEGRHVALRGKLYARLAPLVDGSLTSDEIVARLEEEFDPAQVYYALLRLQAAGHIGERDDAVPPALSAFWDKVGVTPCAAVARLRNTPVSVTSLGSGGGEEWATALADLGFTIAPRADVRVVVTDTYDHPGLRSINRECLGAGRPWVVVRSAGPVVALGPLFLPGHTCCWECVERRLRLNRPGEARICGVSGPAAPPALVPCTRGLLATQLAVWIATSRNDLLAGAILTWDPVSLSHVRHPVPRIVDCPSCGERKGPTTRRRSGPLAALGSVRCGATEAATPEAFLRVHEGLISPLTGIVRGIRRVPFAMDGVHVFVADHSAPLSGRELLQGYAPASAGKGPTEAEARAGALAEAAERVSAEDRGSRPRIRAAFRDINDIALHPNECMLYSARQFRDRRRWNRSAWPTARVPVPFDPGAEIDWSPTWSLTRNTVRFLPTAYLYGAHPTRPRERFCLADSNGCAAGATPDEALLRALLELVERDAVALWWYTRARRPAVDLGAVGDGPLDTLRHSYAAIQRELWVLDITTDLGIPAYAAISRRTNARTEDIMLGFAAHLCPRTAILRAVMEMHQMTAVIGATNSAYGAGPRYLSRWLQRARVARERYLLPTGDCPARVAADPDVADDSAAGVTRCRRVLEERGLEVLAVDLTRADIGVPVVRAVVPGLRHFWPRFAPGRLYDVPAALRWTPRRLREDELNPIPVFV
jgi:bacteriocin biosynthesis cyclodehydratase domain-containing protein